MSTKPLYCNTCKKYVAMEGRVGDYRCPTCHGHVKIGDRPVSTGHREAMRNADSLEVMLREAFETIGLNEDAAKIAAKGRGNLGLSSDFDEAKLNEVLTNAFMDMGLSESAAQQAVRGRGALDLPDNFDEEKFKAVLAESFRKMGLSDEGAKIAANGRK